MYTSFSQPPTPRLPHVPLSHRKTPGPHFSASLTQATVITKQLNTLLDAMIEKWNTSQILLPGAKISQDENSPDLAKLVVVDAAVGDRIYLVSKFVLRGTGRYKPGGKDIATYDFTQYQDGDSTKKPIRSIQLIHDPTTGEDRMIYDTLSKPNGESAIVSNDYVLVLRFRQFIQKLETAGLFDPSAALDQANSDTLVF
jgi:hypothetical protein